MTFREKLEMEHPEDISDGFFGGYRRCPFNYDYESEEQSPCRVVGVDCCCSDCWDREIPGTEKTAELKPIDPHHVFNKMAEKHRACYDSYKCFGFTDEQAFELVRIMFEKDVMTGETSLL